MLKTLCIASTLALVLTASCGGAQSPASTRATARAAVSVAADAWQAAGEACLAVAGTQGDAGAATVAKCKTDLVPAYDLIMGAAAAVDTNWTGGAACDLVKATGLVANTVSVLPGLDSTVTNGVYDAKLLAQALAGQVCAADGGAE